MFTLLSLPNPALATPSWVLLSKRPLLETRCCSTAKVMIVVQQL
jgi:hypothetical protein